MLEILLSTAEELRLVDGVLSVLYQMVLFEDLLASGEVSNSMTHIMATLNMCLQRPGNREPRVSSLFLSTAILCLYLKRQLYQVC